MQLHLLHYFDSLHIPLQELGRDAESWVGHLKEWSFTFLQTLKVLLEKESLFCGELSVSVSIEGRGVVGGTVVTFILRKRERKREREGWKRKREREEEEEEGEGEGRMEKD